MRESRKPPFFNPGSCDRDVAGPFFLFNDDNDSDKAAGFVIMSSVRQAKQGRSSCRLVREQVMMATDNDDEISEHGLLGFSRMIIHKNIKEPLIGGCSSSIMICVDIHM